MTSVFNGMASALNATFGADVTLIDLAAVQITVKAVFRDMPLEVELSDGRPVGVMVPTLKVRRDLVPGIAKGWTVRPSIASPREFKVLRVEPSGSPAADAFWHCVLEE